MANVPAELRYTREHEWARAEGGRVRVGITAYAQEQLGDIVFVELPKTGAKVTRMDMDEFKKPHLRPDGTRHKFDIAYKDHPRKGYIGLQDHGSPCWFKNIKIKPLK